MKITNKQLVAELRELASMKHESFCHIYEQDDDPLPRLEADVDAFIKRRAHFFQRRLNHVCDKIEQRLVKK